MLKPCNLGKVRQQFGAHACVQPTIKKKVKGVTVEVTNPRLLGPGKPRALKQGPCGMKSFAVKRDTPGAVRTVKEFKSGKEQVTYRLPFLTEPHPVTRTCVKVCDAGKARSASGRCVVAPHINANGKVHGVARTVWVDKNTGKRTTKFLPGTASKPSYDRNGKKLKAITGIPNPQAIQKTVYGLTAATRNSHGKAVCESQGKKYSVASGTCVARTKTGTRYVSRATGKATTKFVKGTAKFVKGRWVGGQTNPNATARPAKWNRNAYYNKKYDSHFGVMGPTSLAAIKRASTSDLEKVVKGRKTVSSLKTTSSRSGSRRTSPIGTTVAISAGPSPSTSELSFAQAMEGRFPGAMSTPLPARTSSSSRRTPAGLRQPSARIAAQLARTGGYAGSSSRK